MLFKNRRQYRAANLIREAVDNYPDGICFAAVDGRPILVNRKMNELYWELRGRTITNAHSLWEDGKAAAFEADGERQLLLRTPDQRVWQMQRQELLIGKTTVIQYIAADITELFAYRNRLRENNAKAAELHKRQRELLQNIVQNNLDRELLNAKIRIHDAFGRLLVMTENSLAGGDRSESAFDLISAWENAAADMKNAAVSPGPQQPSPERELVQTAEMIGCRVEFTGKQPSERKALLLLYAAIREALTNAVRHANASRLLISIRESAGRYQVLIENNGRTDVRSVREGGGLSSLRKRLEQDGATMEVVCDRGVALKLTIPKE